MPETMADNVSSGTQYPARLHPAITTVLQLLAGTAAVGSLLVVVGVTVRFLAFAMDDDLHGATSFARSLPPSDLAFLGAQELLSPVTTLFALFAVVLSMLATTPRIARLRALLQFRAAGKEIESRAPALDELNSQIARELLRTDPDRGRLIRLVEDATRTRDELKAARDEMEEQYRQAEQVPDPASGRSYPILKFGIAFASRRIYYGTIAVVALFLFGQVLTRNFPRVLIENIAVLGSVGLLIHGLFWQGSLRPARLLFAAAIAIAGATATGAMAYRNPIGLFEWIPGASLADGRYASIGESDGTTYVVSCSHTSGGVEAVPSSSVRRVTYSSLLDEASGPSLIDMVMAPGSTPRVGALLGCD